MLNGQEDGVDLGLFQDLPEHWKSAECIRSLYAGQADRPSLHVAGDGSAGAAETKASDASFVASITATPVVTPGTRRSGGDASGLVGSNQAETYARGPAAAPYRGVGQQLREMQPVQSPFGSSMILPSGGGSSSSTSSASSASSGSSTARILRAAVPMAAAAGDVSRDAARHAFQDPVPDVAAAVLHELQSATPGGLSVSSGSFAPARVADTSLKSSHTAKTTAGPNTGALFAWTEETPMAAASSATSSVSGTMSASALAAQARPTTGAASGKMMSPLEHRELIGSVHSMEATVHRTLDEKTGLREVASRQQLRANGLEEQLTHMRTTLERMQRALARSQAQRLMDAIAGAVRQANNRKRVASFVRWKYWAAMGPARPQSIRRRRMQHPRTHQHSQRQQLHHDHHRRQGHSHSHRRHPHQHDHHEHHAQHVDDSTVLAAGRKDRDRDHEPGVEHDASQYEYVFEPMVLEVDRPPRRLLQAVTQIMRASLRRNQKEESMRRALYRWFRIAAYEAVSDANDVTSTMIESTQQQVACASQARGSVVARLGQRLVENRKRRTLRKWRELARGAFDLRPVATMHFRRCLSRWQLKKQKFRFSVWRRTTLEAAGQMHRLTSALLHCRLDAAHRSLLAATKARRFHHWHANAVQRARLLRHCLSVLHGLHCRLRATAFARWSTCHQMIAADRSQHFGTQARRIALGALFLRHRQLNKAAGWRLWRRMHVWRGEVAVHLGGLLRARLRAEKRLLKRYVIDWRNAVVAITIAQSGRRQIRQRGRRMSVHMRAKRDTRLAAQTFARWAHLTRARRFLKRLQVRAVRDMVRRMMSHAFRNWEIRTIVKVRKVIATRKLVSTCTRALRLRLRSRVTFWAHTSKHANLVALRLLIATQETANRESQEEIKKLRRDSKVAQRRLSITQEQFELLQGSVAQRMVDASDKSLVSRIFSRWARLAKTQKRGRNLVLWSLRRLSSGRVGIAFCKWHTFARNYTTILQVVNRMRGRGAGQAFHHWRLVSNTNRLRSRAAARIMHLQERATQRNTLRHLYKISHRNVLAAQRASGRRVSLSLIRKVATTSKLMVFKAWKAFHRESKRRLIRLADVYGRRRKRSLIAVWVQWRLSTEQHRSRWYTRVSDHTGAMVSALRRIHSRALFQTWKRESAGPGGLKTMDRVRLAPLYRVAAALWSAAMGHRGRVFSTHFLRWRVVTMSAADCVDADHLRADAVADAHDSLVATLTAGHGGGGAVVPVHHRHPRHHRLSHSPHHDRHDHRDRHGHRDHSPVLQAHHHHRRQQQQQHLQHRSQRIHHQRFRQRHHHLPQQQQPLQYDPQQLPPWGEPYNDTAGGGQFAPYGEAYPHPYGSGMPSTTPHSGGFPTPYTPATPSPLVTIGATTPGAASHADASMASNASDQDALAGTPRASNSYSRWPSPGLILLHQQRERQMAQAASPAQSSQRINAGDGTDGDMPTPNYDPDQAASFPSGVEPGQQATAPGEPPWQYDDTHRPHGGNGAGSSAHEPPHSSPTHHRHHFYHRRHHERRHHRHHQDHDHERDHAHAHHHHRHPAQPQRGGGNGLGGGSGQMMLSTPPPPSPPPPAPSSSNPLSPATHRVPFQASHVERSGASAPPGSETARGNNQTTPSAPAVPSTPTTPRTGSRSGTHIVSSVGAPSPHLDRAIEDFVQFAQQVSATKGGLGKENAPQDMIQLFHEAFHMSEQLQRSRTMTAVVSHASALCRTLLSPGLSAMFFMLDEDTGALWTPAIGPLGKDMKEDDQIWIQLADGDAAGLVSQALRQKELCFAEQPGSDVDGLDAAQIMRAPFTMIHHENAETARLRVVLSVDNDDDDDDDDQDGRAGANRNSNSSSNNNNNNHEDSLTSMASATEQLRKTNHNGNISGVLVVPLFNGERDSPIGVLKVLNRAGEADAPSFAAGATLEDLFPVQDLFRLALVCAQLTAACMAVQDKQDLDSRTKQLNTMRLAASQIAAERGQLTSSVDDVGNQLVSLSGRVRHLEQSRNKHAKRAQHYRTRSIRLEQERNAWIQRASALQLHEHTSRLQQDSTSRVQSMLRAVLQPSEDKVAAPGSGTVTAALPAARTDRTDDDRLVDVVTGRSLSHAQATGRQASSANASAGGSPPDAGPGSTTNLKSGTKTKKAVKRKKNTKRSSTGTKAPGSGRRE